jgi:hypothetical protein
MQLSLFPPAAGTHEKTGILSVDELFRPNGRQRCEGCSRPLTPFAGRLYCLNVGCTGKAR